MSYEKSELSIIVPVYNCVKYIDNAISSVLKQTYSKWELILVDDGSTDGSECICDEYAKKDSRIKVIHQANAGVSAARNSGLDCAEGDYVMFVDADDNLSEGYCETLMQYAAETGLVIGGYTEVTKKSEKKIFMNTQKFSRANYGAAFEELFAKRLSNAPWAKIYQRSIIGSQKFDSCVSLGEDLLFNLDYCSKCSNIQIVNTSGYYYNCVNENAATKKIRDTDNQQILELYKASKLFVEQYCGNHFKSNVLERILCFTGLYLIQSIFYSEKPVAKKKLLVTELLNSPDFQYSCSLKFNFNLMQCIPQILVRFKSLRLLFFFFFVKKCLSNVRVKINVV